MEARGELPGLGIVNKDHYAPQLIQSDLLIDPSWQSIKRNMGDSSLIAQFFLLFGPKF